MNSSRSTFHGIRLFLQTILAGTLASQITFLLVWFVRNPPDEFSEMLSLIPFSLLVIGSALIPVVIVLVFSALLIHRFWPLLRRGSLLALVIYFMIGTALAIGIVLIFSALLIDLDGEFFRVALLSGAVGGAVAGMLIERN